MKRILCLLVLCSAAAGIAVAAAQEEGAVAGSENELIDMHVFHFKVNIPWVEMTDLYAAENPHVVFTNEIRGGGAQWMTILKSKFAADAAPDIFVVEGPGQAKVFADFLSDLGDEPWVDRAVPFAVEGLRLDGVIQGQPVNLEGYGYIYNKTMFADAGIGEPPATFSELRSVAETLQAAGQTPFATGYGEWWVIGLHLANIAFAMQPDPQAFVDGLMAGTTTMAGNEYFLALQHVVDLNVEYGEANPLTTDNIKQQTLFITEEAAMMQQGNWKEIVVQDAAPDLDAGVFPIPLTDDPAVSNRLAIGIPFYFVVNNSSPERDQVEARKFLNWLVDSETGRSWLTEQFGFIPAYGDIEPVGLGGISADLLGYAARDQAIPWMFGQFPDGIPQEFAANMQAYVGGRQSWDDTLAEMDRQWQRLK